MKRITTPHAAPQSSSLLRTLSLALLMGMTLTPTQVALAQGKVIIPSRDLKRTDLISPVVTNFLQYPSKASSVSEFFRLLQLGPKIQPSKKGNSKKSGPVGGAEQARQNGAAGPLLCSVQKYNLASSPP